MTSLQIPGAVVRTETRSRIVRAHNLKDMLYSPAFSTHSQDISRRPAFVFSSRTEFAAFWDYVGARNLQPSKYQCRICGASIKKRGTKHCICKRCWPNYHNAVRRGEKMPDISWEKAA